MYESKREFFYGTGRRKQSIARVRLYPGTGAITINDRDIDEFFGLDTLKLIVRQPLELTKTTGKFDVVCRVEGGGVRELYLRAVGCELEREPSKLTDATDYGITAAEIRLEHPALVGLGEALRAQQRGGEKIESITLVGLCTDICVISNALLLKAFLPETPVIVDAACCAGVTPESHRRALEAMRVCQIEIANG